MALYGMLIVEHCLLLQYSQKIYKRLIVTQLGPDEL